ncbi:MAG: molecular chaperone HtpG [Turicibacter sp.]|nr:molecular chaperone HtpG [Turicibacter sp.]
MEKGNLSIHSENILPIIKKWLYSEPDIFVRELVSNASDAVLKLKKLADMGETKIPKSEKFSVTVTIDEENKQLIFEDNGVGMTADEIREYINQIAFSGASAFLEKYQDKLDKNGENSEIIGHFGLGFYSSFMVADKVQIDSLSWQKGSTATRWQCEGGIEYEMSEGERTTRGTTITLFVNSEHESFLSDFKIRNILIKYCNFLPIEIYVKSTGDEEEQPKPINDTKPLWLKPPNECKDKEYIEFYKKVFLDFQDPLFWIHLNMDYPFRLQGILYFPKLKHELEYMDGQVKLYNNQVFVADNIKEVIPEYLLLLKGVMDCPDLPLNVSRSFLQSDAQVRKMSGYISRKVADKLNSIFKKDRKKFTSYWDDISPFIKYGCIKEGDFYDKVKQSMLYKTTNGDYFTLEEFLERNKEKTGNTVFYVSDDKQQAQYIKLFDAEGMEAVLLTKNLDMPYINYLEQYEDEAETKFKRIDSSLSENLKQGEVEDEALQKQEDEIEGVFRKLVGNDQLVVTIETLKSSDVSAIMLLSEEMRRTRDMMINFGNSGPFSADLFENGESLTLNRNNKLVQILLDLHGNQTRKEDFDLIARQVYDLAMLGHKPLSNEQMTNFIERSNRILERIVS